MTNRPAACTTTITPHSLSSPVPGAGIHLPRGSLYERSSYAVDVEIGPGTQHGRKHIRWVPRTVMSSYDLDHGKTAANYHRIVEIGALDGRWHDQRTTRVSDKRTS